MTPRLLDPEDTVMTGRETFCKKYTEPENRKYLDEILKDVFDTILPSGPFEPDEAEIEHDEDYGREGSGGAVDIRIPRSSTILEGLWKVYEVQRECSVRGSNNYRRRVDPMLSSEGATTD